MRSYHTIVYSAENSTNWTDGSSQHRISLVCAKNLLSSIEIKKSDDMCRKWYLHYGDSFLPRHQATSGYIVPMGVRAGRILLVNRTLKMKLFPFQFDCKCKSILVVSVHQVCGKSQMSVEPVCLAAKKMREEETSTKTRSTHVRGKNYIFCS